MYTFCLQVLLSFDAWLLEKEFINTAEKRMFAFGADGHFDLQFFVDGECTRKKIPKAEYFDKWVNLKQLFADHYKVRARLFFTRELLRQLKICIYTHIYIYIYTYIYIYIYPKSGVFRQVGQS